MSVLAMGAAAALAAATVDIRMVATMAGPTDIETSTMLSVFWHLIASVLSFEKENVLVESRFTTRAKATPSSTSASSCD